MEIIKCTIDNMQLIFEDIGKIIQVIEEQMLNNGFQPKGDSGCTWENSSSLYNPNNWLFKYFARFYMKDSSLKQGVGFCIHLRAYEHTNIEKFKQLSLSLPVMNVSLLRLNKPCHDIARNAIYNLLWGSGWVNDDWIRRKKISNNMIVRSDILDDDVNGSAITYFINPLLLSSSLKVKNNVTDPLINLFKGEDDLLLKSKLPIIRIPSV